MLIEIIDIPDTEMSTFIEPREKVMLEDVLHILTEEQWDSLAQKYDVTVDRVKTIFTGFVHKCVCDKKSTHKCGQPIKGKIVEE